MASNEKICSKCGVGYPHDHYYTITNKYGKTYTYNYCRKCHYKITKSKREQWVKDNPKRATKLQTKATRNYIDKMKAGVYLIQTDKGCYVGHSDHVRFRIIQHKSHTQFSVERTKNAKILHWVILEEIDDLETRREREKYWIKKLEPTLNIRLG